MDKPKASQVIELEKYRDKVGGKELRLLEIYRDRAKYYALAWEAEYYDDEVLAAEFRTKADSLNKESYDVWGEITGLSKEEVRLEYERAVKLIAEHTKGHI
ncbi:hypothetical protein OH784_27505 [Ectobacillus funiculus]|uniref:hypothetical protein n=1 Tax=Ectobacillus funiculus TaxID=137993 RepID=UPI00397A8E49